MKSPGGMKNRADDAPFAGVSTASIPAVATSRSLAAASRFINESDDIHTFV
jgi:hypothetical protein